MEMNSHSVTMCRNWEYCVNSFLKKSYLPNWATLCDVNRLMFGSRLDWANNSKLIIFCQYLLLNFSSCHAFNCATHGKIAYVILNGTNSYAYDYW